MACLLVSAYKEASYLVVLETDKQPLSYPTRMWPQLNHITKHLLY